MKNKMTGLKALDEIAWLVVDRYPFEDGYNNTYLNDIKEEEISTIRQELEEHEELKKVLDTIKEALKQKQEKAQNDIDNNNWFDKYEMHELIGQRDAYTDLIELIENQIGKE